MEDDKKHRDYATERKAKIEKMTDDLRGSDELLAEFVKNPDDVTDKYGVRLTEEEAAALVTVVQGEELDEEALAAVAGGNGNCGNCNCTNDV